MKVIFFVILMVSLVYGQDSTITQIVERFTIEMNTALDEIVSFQIQVDSLKQRITLLEQRVFLLESSGNSLMTIDGHYLFTSYKNMPMMGINYMQGKKIK